MQKQLTNFVDNPESGDANFYLAVEYLHLKHYAGAVSHFIRCCEFSDPERDYNIIYESLIHLSHCFRELGNRSMVEKGWLLHAVSFCPDRPEAYWALSLWHEYRRNWQEAYSFACIGLDNKYNSDSIIEPIAYEGEYMLVFQKAVAAWWIGRFREARELFFQLPQYPLNGWYQQLVQQNLSNLGAIADPIHPFSQEKYPKLRSKFPGSGNIVRNYSQAYQDMFVLSMLDGKQNGFYVEIGSADPVQNSNTFLLEKEFGWDGISVEIKEDLVKKFRNQRSNKVVCRDATTIDYGSFLKGIGAPGVIDYLQLDCEPPKTTFDILTSIPFELYQFRVITFEHDWYADATRQYRELSRNFLQAKGYKLVVSNVAVNDVSPFEDWWVHPDLVDPDIMSGMLADDDAVKHVEKYMLSVRPDDPQSLTPGFSLGASTAISEPTARRLSGVEVGVEVPVYVITHADFPDRRAAIEKELDALGIYYYTMLTSHKDDTETIVTGKRIHELDRPTLLCACSHLRAIIDFAHNSKQDIALFLEDDVTFETAPYWGFSFDEFIKRLPRYWDCVQLLLVKENLNEVKLRPREFGDWAASAYLMKKDYAKKLMGIYIPYHPNMTATPAINLDVPDGSQPLVEHLLFTPGKTYVYPLLTENLQFKSTWAGREKMSDNPAVNATGHKDNHVASANFVLNWWKNSNNSPA